MSKIFRRASTLIHRQLWAVCLMALFSPITSSALAADSVTEPSGGLPSKRPEAWKFNNEQDWIVDSTGRDIAEILAFAGHSPGERGKLKIDDISFSTKCVDQPQHMYALQYAAGPERKVSQNITLSDYVWSTKNYEPLAKAILDSSKLDAAPASSVPTDFIKSLANADWNGLLGENDRISKALSESPLDPSLHEQAALLQAAFTMQDECGSFTDFRPALERVCAHLTLARALNNEKLGDSGKLAEIFEETFCGRTGDAVDHIDGMLASTDDAAVKSWLRALKIHCTCDYRIFDEKNQTAIEERQYAVRYSINRAGLAILEYMEQHHPRMGVGEMRIVLNTNYTVEAGHVSSTRIVPAELSAFMQDCVLFKRSCAGDFEKASLELNLLPTRCLVSSTESGDTGTPTSALQVISWNDVAAFHMRHILNAVGGEHHFYAHLYCVPELAKKSVEQTFKFLSKVDQVPFAMRYFELDDQQKKERQRSIVRILTMHPEAVTSWNWPASKEKGADQDKSKLADQVPVPPELWFDPPLPFGTAYFYTDRAQLLNFKKNLAELSELHKINPFHEEIAGEYARQKYGEHPTSDQYVEAFGKMNDYNLRTMKLTAEAAVEEPDRCIELEKKMALTEPMTYFGLGNYCVLFNRPEQAAEFYEQGLKECSNSVVASNSANWLLMYRLERGQKDKAAELAKFCGEVFSQRGLMTMAGYYEKTGNLKKAEEIYRSLAERYDSKRELLAFLIRNEVKNPAYKAEAAPQIKELFPDGLKRVSLADFSSPPSRGLIVEAVDQPQSASPFKKGMIIVATNGYLDQTLAQHNVLKFILQRRYLTAIVWDGSKYHDVTRPYANDFNLGVTVKEYRVGR